MESKARLAMKEIGGKRDQHGGWESHPPSSWASLLFPSWEEQGSPGKFYNRLLTEILTEVPISHSLIEFNQLFNR